MIPCIWYVSGETGASSGASPWVRTLAASMAASLRARGVSLSLCIDGGITGLADTEGVCSWGALTGLERMSRILFSGRALWHLWGKAPAWWGIIRLYSRAVHTSFDERPVWRGYPSRLFAEQAKEGEAVLVPAFESRVSHSSDSFDGGASAPAIYAGMGAASSALKELLDEWQPAPLADLDALRFDLSQARSGVLVAGTGPFEAIRAAGMTMQGLTVASLRSPYLDSLLGREGYFAVPEDTTNAWRNTIEAALSEQGRALAVSARHFIKTRCSADRCADSLLAAYKEVLGGR